MERIVDIQVFRFWLQLYFLDYIYQDSKLVKFFWKYCGHKSIWIRVPAFYVYLLSALE